MYDISYTISYTISSLFGPLLPLMSSLRQSAWPDQKAQGRNARSCVSKGVWRRGVGSFVRNSYVSTLMPCRPVPLLVTSEMRSNGLPACLLLASEWSSTWISWTRCFKSWTFVLCALPGCDSEHVEEVWPVAGSRSLSLESKHMLIVIKLCLMQWQAPCWNLGWQNADSMRFEDVAFRLPSTEIRHR